MTYIIAYISIALVVYFSLRAWTIKSYRKYHRSLMPVDSWEGVARYSRADVKDNIILSVFFPLAIVAVAFYYLSLLLYNFFDYLSENKNL